LLTSMFRVSPTPNGNNSERKVKLKVEIIRNLTSDAVFVTLGKILINATEKTQ